jgi:thioredoxin-dependent peroxiredoxin
VAGKKGLQVGDPAPDFTLPSSTGDLVSLSDFRGREVVLFFYPRDNSPACTAEACSFRDNDEAFREAGAQVIGISGDSPGSHLRFASRFDLPYPLLSDGDGEVRKRYGVRRTLGLIPGRVTFLIDGDGVVRHILSSQFEPSRHVSEVRDVLKSLRDNPGTRV